MKITALSKTAAAVALGLASLGAQAAAVLIDFEDLGRAVLATRPAGGLITAATPIVVGNQVTNFQFGAAWAWEYDMMTTSDKKPEIGLSTPTNTGGFILNVPRATSGGSPPSVISLTWTGGLYNGLLLKSISYDMFATGATPFLRGLNASGGEATPVAFPTFSEADGERLWSRQTFEFGDSSVVSRLEFGTNGGGVVGLDNFRLDWVASSTGGTVPEPASFALAALALLGAGAASRRRKSH